MCLALNPALRHLDEAKRRTNQSTAWDGTAIVWEPSHHRNFFKVVFYSSDQSYDYYIIDFVCRF